jgi:hypothetical protein
LSQLQLKLQSPQFVGLTGSGSFSDGAGFILLQLKSHEIVGVGGSAGLGIPDE